MDKPTKQLIYDFYNPKPFYPKNLMNNIFDGEDGANLYSYLSKFNHINVGFVNSPEEARRSIHSIFKRKGLYITYIINNRTITEYFSGTNQDALIEEKWINNNNWTTHDVNYSADVVEVTSSEKAYAGVVLQDGEFQFTFGLPRGLDGAPGPAGPPGDSAIAYKTVFVFKASDEKPNKPIGGSWNYTTDEVIYPEGWEPNNENLEGIIWMSQGTFSQSGDLSKDWSDPIRITGDKGESGADGAIIEFIYKLTLNSLQTPTKPNSINEDDYIPEGWTDSPKGITSTNKVEWVCTRKKQNNIWSDWSEPVIWSKWGENGMDGDGVEYIYKLTSTGEPPTRPEDVSQEDDYIPEGWTDNPTGVSIENPYEWVCVRKSKNGIWGAFSNPALWAKYGEDGTNGIGIRIMYTKTDNSSIKPEVVKDNINPGSIWGIGIPNYEGNEAIWAIQGQINYKNELVGIWQGPYLVTGVNGKNALPVNYKTYVYKLSATKPNKPTSNDPRNPGDGWVDYPNTTGQWWQCIGDVNGATELITNWSEVLPVNGQDGIAQDGKFTEFRFAKSTNDAAPSIFNNLRNPGDNWTKEPPSVDSNNNESLWMTSAIINPDDTLNTNWSNPIRISGERGPQGATGPAGEPGVPGSQGASGLPGISFMNLYFTVSSDDVDEYGNFIIKKDGISLYTLIKTLYDNYKNDINILDKGTIDEPLLSDLIGEDTITEIKRTIDYYKNAYETGINPETGEAATDEEKYEYFNAYTAYEWQYYKGLKFVSSIDDLYITLYNEDGTTNKTKLFPYIGFIQAKVVYDEFGNYSFAEGTTEWSEPTLLTGINGLNGNNGKDGKGIKSIIDYYKLTSTYDKPIILQTDSTTPLNPNKKNPYLWVNEMIIYTDYTYKWTGVRLLAKYTEDAISITNTLTTYGVSNSPTIKPSNWSTTIPITSNNEYLWTRIQITYSNDEVSESFTVVRNGITPNGIERIDEEYGLSNDVDVYPTLWNSNPMSPTSENPYAWNKETIRYTDGSIQENEPHIYALYLNDGVQGKPGDTIENIINYYCVSKINVAPKFDVSNDDNIYNKKWYDDYLELFSVNELLKNYPDKEYPYLYNYEKTILSSGVSYSSPIRQIAKYVENGTSTINLYCVGINNNDWDELSIPLLIFNYYKDNPNFINVNWNYIKNEPYSTKLVIFSDFLGSDITEEEINEFIDTYGPFIDLFSSDLIFIDGDGVSYPATEYPVYMTKANIIINPNGTYEFAEGTTEWSEPIRINSKDGTSVNRIIVEYALHDSKNAQPIEGWQETVPTPTKEKPYVWQRTQYKNNDVLISQTYNLYQTGKDGVSIEEIIEYYCISSSNTTAPTDGWTTSVQTMTSVNRYLWNYEVFQMSDGSSKETAKRVIGVYGRDGEAVGGIGIKSIDEYYILWIVDSVAPNFELGDDGTPTNSSWVTTFPDTSSLYKYVWNVQVITYTDNTKYVSPVVCIYRQSQDGVNGADGTNGEDGIGIKSIVNYYLLTNSTSGITIQTSGWTTTIQTPTQTKRYVWNYEKITYTDGSIYNSPPHIIAGMGQDGQDGQDGEQGKKGQLVYPAGIYSNTKSYTTDDDKAPYVLDSSDGNFYVLNAKMTWRGTSQGNRTPAQDYTQNGGKYWLKFEAFDAIYAKIGIIANGLIGSAVFNGDWMFSQYGISYTGAQNTNYEYFNPSWLTLTKFTSSVKFVPKYAVDLRTGMIYIHGTGTSSNIPSLTIKDGSITFCKKSYYTTDNYITKIINGNIVYHANGNKLFSFTGSSYNIQVYGICSGVNPSALITTNNGNTYYKLLPFNGIPISSNGLVVSDDNEALISINGIMYVLGYANTVSNFTSWLNSIS